MNKFAYIKWSPQVLAILTVLVTFAPPAWANGIGISTAWQETQLDREQCLSRAQLALWRSGFWQNLKTELRSVAAEAQGYQAVIRCLPETQTVLFTVAGRDSVQAEEFQVLISKNF